MLEANQILYHRYHLIQKLGQNAGRQTWKATDLTSPSPEPVIVKLLALDPYMQWDDLKLFEREATILAQLNHPFIPHYRDYFSVRDRLPWFSLVHDYIPGYSLRYWLSQGKRFSSIEVQTIATQILEILIYLHELSPSVLHRDIKPSNIILGATQSAYLVDFGAVQARSSVEGTSFTVVGTYGYTPMEQFGGRAVAASDLYALGATLIHMLTGTTPAQLPQKNMRIQFRQYVSLRPSFLDWIEILIAPDVGDRFPTARQALSSLNQMTRIPPTCSVSATALDIVPHRIHMKKTAQQLHIAIPSRGIRWRDSPVLLWTVIVYGAMIPFGMITFPFGSIHWVAGLFPLAWLLLQVFGHVDLLFDRTSFKILRKVSGVPYHSTKGHIALIQNIYENSSHPMQLNGFPRKTVSITTKQHEYHVGGIAAPLSELERRWLITELTEWLGVSAST